MAITGNNTLQREESPGQRGPVCLSWQA